MNIKCKNNQSKFMTGRMRRIGGRWGLGEGVGYFNLKIHGEK